MEKIFEQIDNLFVNGVINYLTRDMKYILVMY